MRQKKTGKYKLIIAVILLVFTQGCATLEIHRFVAASKRPEEYRRFFEALDKTIDKAKVRDAGYITVKGFPYLRANRFLIGLKKKIKTDAQKTQWVEWMRQLDLEARQKEIHNLPESALKEVSTRLGENTDANLLLSQLTEYSEKMIRHDSRHPDFYDSLKSAALDPGEYSLFLRAIGIYPLFAVPVTYSTNKAYNHLRRAHKTPPGNLKVQGKLKAYAASKRQEFPFEDIGKMFDASRKDVLGIPRLTKEEIDRLVFALSPVFYQDETGSYDKIGEAVWQDHAVKINYERPVVYYYITYGFIRDEPALQINYTLWYTERPAPHTPWMERGPIDGITARVSLDANGLPIMVDVMNNCGCYHFFVPRKDSIERVIPKPFFFDPLVTSWLPEPFPKEHISLRIHSGWHQVRNISAGKIPEDAIAYELVPYEELESLPHSDGRRESVFDPYGIMKSSKSIEPFILFSMGVPAVGYMRQRENHPTKLLRVEHFTDPGFFDKNFLFRQE